MMFWCHNCQQPIHSVQKVRCEICSCEAIQEISQSNNPQNFQPYVSQSQTQTTHSQQNQQTNSRLPGLMIDPFGIDMFRRMTGAGSMGLMSSFLSSFGQDTAPVFVRYTVRTPVLSVLIIGDEEESKNPVGPEKMSQMQKVTIKEECAICQQKQGAGLRLPCKHEFHEQCIKPWFEQTNTCPCCRTAV